VIDLPATAPLVEAAWLAQRIDHPGIQVVDCRWELGDPDGGREAYAAGHIAGASFLDLDRDLSGRRFDGPNGRGRHPLPTPEDFAAAARRAGVTQDGVVVAYDQGMTGGAARLWWLLRAAGKSDVLVLDGGLPAWPKPLETGRPSIAEGDFAASEFEARAIADHESVLAAVANGSAVVVDARSAERFRGEQEPVDPVAGHIPGSRNAPGSEPLPSWLTADARPVIASCGSGVAACITLLRLAASGHDDLRLYAGSWSDWIERDLPVATGDS
jgi:thiosulfate/3-mercaptopyruvate sulfurtransferase